MDCPMGYFQPQDQAPSTTCVACPKGFSQNSTGESNCVDLGWKKASDCRGNSFLDDTQVHDPVKWECTVCPAGTTCVGVDVTAQMIGSRGLEGWWQCPNDPMRFEPCSVPGACRGLSADSSGVVRGPRENFTALKKSSCRRKRDRTEPKRGGGGLSRAWEA